MNHRRFLRRNVADKYLVPFAARALRPCNVFIPELYFRLTDINFFDNLRFCTAVFKIERTDISPAVFLICIEISPAAVDPDDVEMLQDLILSAVNEAVRLANETMEKEMSKVTGGLGNLGGFGF